MKDNGRPEFSHPSESHFANILDFYKIRWEYEPRTFILEQDGQGNVLEAFTPDFYLPDQDLYIELTTLKPKLAAYKNRRIRLMQERYPEIRVKLLKRRELREMMVKFGLYQDANNIQGSKAQSEDRHD